MPYSDANNAPGPPEGLTEISIPLWTELVSDLEFRPDELEVLSQACRTLELIRKLETAIEDQPLIVKGSHGGTVPNPLLGQLATHRTLFGKLIRQLAIPDDNEHSRAGTSRSAAGRALVMQRWGRG